MTVSILLEEEALSVYVCVCVCVCVCVHVDWLYMCPTGPHFKGFQADSGFGKVVFVDQTLYWSLWGSSHAGYWVCVNV